MIVFLLVFKGYYKSCWPQVFYCEVFFNKYDLDKFEIWFKFVSDSQVTSLLLEFIYDIGFSVSIVFNVCKNDQTDLIIPHVLTAEETTSLLNDARNVMKRISKGGKGITRHDVYANGGRRLSPIGRVLATFETGQ